MCVSKPLKDEFFNCNTLMATFLIDHFSNENSLWYLNFRLKVEIFFQRLPVCWPFLSVKENCNRVTGSVLKRPFFILESRSNSINVCLYNSEI